MIALLSVLFLMRIQTYPDDGGGFDRDENYWIRSSRYFKMLFLDHNTRWESWRDYGSVDQPVLGKYFIGLTLYLNGYDLAEIQRLPKFKYYKSYTENTDSGNAVLTETLQVCRRAVAVTGILSCLLLYWLGKELFSRRVGIIAAALLAFNPLMDLCSRRILTDTPLLFLVLLSLAVSVLFFKSWKTGRKLHTWLWAACVGIMAGLAVSMKLNGVLTLWALFAATVMFIVYAKKSGNSVGSLTKPVVLAACLALAVFVAINPYLYKQPLVGMQKMVKHRLWRFHCQQLKTGSGLYTTPARVNAIISRTLSAHPRSFAPFGRILPLPVDFILFLWGLWSILKKEREVITVVVLSAAVVTFVTLVLTLPLNWERYFLPLIPYIALIEAYGLCQIRLSPTTPTHPTLEL